MQLLLDAQSAQQDGKIDPIQVPHEVDQQDHPPPPQIRAGMSPIVSTATGISNRERNTSNMSELESISEHDVELTISTKNVRQEGQSSPNPMEKRGSPTREFFDVSPMVSPRNKKPQTPDSSKGRNSDSSNSPGPKYKKHAQPSRRGSVHNHSEDTDSGAYKRPDLQLKGKRHGIQRHGSISSKGSESETSPRASFGSNGLGTRAPTTGSDFEMSRRGAYRSSAPRPVNTSKTVTRRNSHSGSGRNSHAGSGRNSHVGSGAEGSGTDYTPMMGKQSPVSARTGLIADVDSKQVKFKIRKSQEGLGKFKESMHSSFRSHTVDEDYDGHDESSIAGVSSSNNALPRRTQSVRLMRGRHFSEESQTVSGREPVIRRANSTGPQRLGMPSRRLVENTMTPSTRKPASRVPMRRGSSSSRKGPEQKRWH